MNFSRSGTTSKQKGDPLQRVRTERNSYEVKVEEPKLNWDWRHHAFSPMISAFPDEAGWPDWAVHRSKAKSDVSGALLDTLSLASFVLGALVQIQEPGVVCDVLYRTYMQALHI